MHPDHVDFNHEDLESKEDCYNEVATNLKSEINEFLYCRLPGDTTIKEIDEIALNLFEKIIGKWNKFMED